MDDLISRQDAIEIIDGYMNRLANHIGTPTDNERYAYARGTLLGVETGINALPSAQPKPLTDEEQRIFLAAMGREEKVCEEIDEEMTREPYEDSLVKTCREIIRKVKGALWTI